MSEIAAQAAKAQVHLLELQGQHDALREEVQGHLEQARLHNAATKEGQAKMAVLSRQIAAEAATLKELGISLKVAGELEVVQKIRAQTEADAKAIAAQNEAMREETKGKNLEADALLKRLSEKEKAVDALLKAAEKPTE